MRSHNADISDKALGFAKNGIEKEEYIDEEEHTNILF